MHIKLPLSATLLCAVMLQSYAAQTPTVESGNWIVKFGSLISFTQAGSDVAVCRVSGWNFGDWTPIGTHGYESVLDSDDGKFLQAIRVKSVFTNGHMRLNFACLDASLKSPLLLVHLNKSLVGSVVKMDDTDYTLPPEKPERAEYPHARTFTVFQHEPLHKLRIDVTQCLFANLRDFRLERSESPFDIFVIPNTQKTAEIDFDLSVADPPQGLAAAIGVKVGGIDPILPKPANGINAIENPSFEGGLSLWGLTPWPLDHTDPSERCGWRLAEGQGRSGRRCAAYTSVKGFHAPMLSPAPILVKPNTRYTISFYAKSDTPGVLFSLWSQGATWGDFPCSKRVVVEKEWKRYAFTFTTQSAFVRFGFGDHWAEAGNVDIATILFDDVQFEEGDTATAFVQKPFFASFENTVAFTGKPAPVKLSVVSSRDTPASVSVLFKVLDVNGRILDSKPFSFTLAPQAEFSETIDLASLNRKGLLRLVAEVKSGDFTDSFFGRLAICDDLSSRPLSLKYLCHRPAGPSLDEVETLSRLGYRGSLGWDLPDPARYRAYEQRGWKHIFTVTEGRDCPVKPFDQKMTETDWTNYFAWIDTRLKPYAGLPVCFKTMNEPDIPWRIWTPADHARIVKHIHDVVKATSPAAWILSPDPYHSGREAQNWIDQFLAAGGKDVIDAVAIHTYGARAESPDLDNNIQSLKAIKAKYGLTQIPILFTEGEGSPLYTIDALGMSPLKGFFEWRLDLLSLDVGPSEATGAAGMARRLLVALKNADTVKSYLTWRNDFDAHSHQPLATLGSVNTVLSLLGDASFVREHIIGDAVRTYVFKSANGMPLAALWCHDLKVERGEVSPPLASLALPDSGWQLLDMMGNPLAFSRTKGNVEFPLGNQPVYLVSKTLSIEELNQALESSHIGGIGLKTVDTTVRLTSLNEAAVTVANKLTRDVSGTLVVSLDGQAVLSTNLTVKTKEAQTVKLPLPGKRDTLNESKLSLVFKDAATGSLSVGDEDFRWFAISPMTKEPSFTGNRADWFEASRLSLDNAAAVVNALAPWQGPADFSGTWYFGYSDKGLYIGAEVHDNVEVTPKTLANAWMADSLQLYFDLRADGHDKPGAGYDSNDESLWAAKIGGQNTLFRDYTPEWQVAFVKGGIVYDARIAVTRREGVIFYEILLPPKEASPLVMKPGTTFGCGLIINDGDTEGTRKQSITNTKPGTEPHSHPELWPHAILTNK